MIHAQMQEHQWNADRATYPIGWSKSHLPRYSVGRSHSGWVVRIAARDSYRSDPPVLVDSDHRSHKTEVSSGCPFGAYLSDYATYRELGSAYQVKPGFVVVSAAVARANPVRTTRNTILGDAHLFVGVRDDQSIAWAIILLLAIRQYRWRGLWVLVGAPLALWLPYTLFLMAQACSHNRLACP
jgi:hypothetical protein